MAQALLQVPTDNNQQYTLDTQYTSGGTSLTLNQSVAGTIQYPGVCVVDRIDSSGNKTATKRTYYKFTGVTGAQLTGLSVVDGTDQTHAVGAIVEFVPDVDTMQSFYDAITQVVAPATGLVDTTKVVTPTGTQTLTNKTLTSPALNTPTVTTPTLNGAVAGTSVDTDGTFAANSDTVIPSQKAVKTYVTANAGASILTTAFYGPQGYLINGKLSVTVSSNNITVAIKGMDGNDPSNSNKVYCRIGDTTRTISAALSVTKNAGTNYFGAGGADFATKEIDYFAYLGYNATDGVVIGFARIPFATRYGDFNTTATNPLYCAISTITTAASTDYYENIGRFAATLSATASFNWSVPTYTAVNLIQRPCYETRWLSWLPTYSGSGSMTFGTVTTTMAVYRIQGNTMFFQLDYTGTTGGTASFYITTTMPLPRVQTDADFTVAGNRIVDSSQNSGRFQWNGSSTTVLGSGKMDGSNWALAASKATQGSGFYDLA